MEGKGTCIITTVLWVAGLLLLIAGAFDVLPVSDNKVMFAAIACFIIGGAIKRIAKGGSCCK
jgi:hypothetical protein